MRSDDVTAYVELANCLWGKKPALGDVMGGEETMGARAEGCEPVGDRRVARNPAVVDGDHGPNSGFGIRDSKAHEPVQLCLELGHRQLVTVSRGRAEAALARIRLVHVMKEQGYGSHV